MIAAIVCLVLSAAAMIFYIFSGRQSDNDGYDSLSESRSWCPCCGRRASNDGYDSLMSGHREAELSAAQSPRGGGGSGGGGTTSAHNRALLAMTEESQALFVSAKATATAAVKADSDGYFAEALPL